MRPLKSIDELVKLRKELTSRPRAQAEIRVCSTGCRAAGALEVCAALEKEISSQGLCDRVAVIKTGCHGLCAGAVAVVITPEELFYAKVTPEDAAEIVERTVVGGEVIDRLCMKDGEETCSKRSDIPFYAHQTETVLRNCGVIDPTSLEDAVRCGAYLAVAKAFDRYTPEEIIEELVTSGLRGRGGAGFPTGMKWRFARAAEGNSKYIICNADEGDPGAFMDRAILEGDPHVVIEGMIIGAYAIGAQKGYLYVRAEYPIAIEHAEIALTQAREAGLLGEGILGTDFSFDIEIRKGAGAFVCGEETALIASIEGARGMPRPRPPFPATSGYRGKPTNINNVETWANVPRIIEDGAEAYARSGTEKSRGTKIFALAGKVRNTGLVEVPMGMTLREIVFDVGGGIPGDGKFKAAQIGGPSGGCVPRQHLDVTIDYDSVQQIGAIMGSGGLIVMDETTCMVDIARFFTDFVQTESCGKCVPCRVGTRRMLEILTRICNGEGKTGDIETLEGMGEMIRDASLCGLGQTAPNPVLTTIRYFREEYEAHVNDKHCPAGVCTALVRLEVIEEKCKACGKCLRVCPAECISGGMKKVPAVIDQKTCIRCRACLEVCPFDAIAVR